jgi:hypothetical protein
MKSRFRHSGVNRRTSYAAVAALGRRSRVGEAAVAVDHLSCGGNLEVTESTASASIVRPRANCRRTCPGRRAPLLEESW